MYNHAPEKYICPFCLVAQGIENEHVLTRKDDVFYQDKYITAFISAGGFGKNKGHALVIPNQHFENIYELPSDLSAKIHAFAKEIALAFKKIHNCDGTSTRQHNEYYGNQDVWHYHLHIFPRYENDNLYSAKREDVPVSERKTRATKLREYFQQNPYIGENKKPSQLVGASVIVYKDGKILLQQRQDNKCWGYHGGRVELGEVVEDAAKRELFEETGLTANSLKLFGVFSGSKLHHVYPDGNEVYIIDTVYTCDDFSGTVLMQSEECLDLQWFDFESIPANLSPPIIPALIKFIEENRTKQ